MAVYPSSRLTVYYSGPLGSHRMNFWKTTLASFSAFYDDVRAVITNMGACQYANTVWTNADYQLAGDNFSVPVAWTPQTSTGAGVPSQNDTVGEYVNFVGRSLTTGRRARLFMYETPFGPGRDMRLNPGASTLLDAVVSNLNNQADTIGAIDGARVTWKTYMNLGINDYWVRQARK